MSNNVTYTVNATDLLSPKLKQMDGNANKLEGSMMSLKGAIAGAFSIYAVQNFIGSVIKAGTTVENATTGLTTLLGDTAAATKVVQNTMEDATKTPFAFEGLLSANKALIGAGVEADTARKDVLNLANAIAATGGGDDELNRMVVNLQQISNTGKATAMDIKQFAFAGVNIYQLLADATGKPISAVKDMEVSYDLLTMALQKAHDKGGIYFNGLENMAGNTSVRISNLGDDLFQFMNDIFIESKPLIDAVITGVADMISVMRDLFGWLKENKDMVQSIGVAFATAGSIIFLYNTYLKTTAILTALTTTSLIAQTFTLGALTAGFAGASAAGTVLAGVMAVINLVNPFTWMVIGIAAVVGGLYYLYNSFEEVRGVFFATWSFIKEYVFLMMDWFTALGDLVVGIFTFDLDQVEKGVKGIGDIIANSAERIGKATREGYEKGIADFKEENSDVTVGVDGVVKPTKTKIKSLITDDTNSSATKGVKGTRNVTVNVSIGSLINDFKIQTTNVQESTTAIKEKVIQALTSALNDSQLIAGQ